MDLQWTMDRHQWVHHHLDVIVHSIKHRADHLVNNFLLALVQWTLMMSHHVEAEAVDVPVGVVVVEVEVDSEGEVVAEAPQ